MSNERIYVGNLSWDSDESGVRAAFTAFGDVTDVKLITDRDTGRPRGFGFVTMGDASQAEAAIEALNGSMLDGRAIRVSVAQERQPRGNGGNGGNGRRW